MIEINKAEARYLREHGVKEITRTMKQKSHRGRKQLVCEDRYIIDLLNAYRNTLKVVFTYGDV